MRTTRPIRHDAKYFFFEVKIIKGLEEPKNGGLAIGLGTRGSNQTGVDPNTVCYITQDDQGGIIQEGALLSQGLPISEGDKLECTVRSIDLGYEKCWEYMFTRNGKDVGPWHYVKACEHYPEVVGVGTGLEIQVTLGEQPNPLLLGTLILYKLLK